MMAINLHQNEQIKISAKIHWSSYLIVGIWAGIFALSLIGQLLGAHSNNNTSGTFFFTAFIGFFPLTYRILQNKGKHYILTNNRLYVENGIIAKSKKDIPIHKMNDVEMSQGIVQRIFGSGDIVVLTGNDKPTRLTNIDFPEVFKNQLTEVMRSKEQKTAA
jgi:uncharacterized membrane protein YdbT with pleckstrin-like domain